MGVKDLVRTSDIRQPTVLGWAWASLVANIGIILTGGLVRLTGSGLGCPTWPRCTEESFVPHSSLGWHGAIEFGNRLLTYVLIAIAIGTFFAVWRWAGATSTMKQLTVLIGIGIPFQGVIGGITVLTQLNPWVVALHLLLSMGLVVAATVLLVLVRGEDGSRVDDLTRRLVLFAYGLLLIAIYLGTIVTGSGPHAGDADAPRNGLDPLFWTRVHAMSVWALVAVTLVVVWRLRGHRVQRAAWIVLAAELLQGAIGYVQHFTGLPIGLVAVHLVGAAILLAATTHLVLQVAPLRRDREPVDA
ncbi:heme A synthase [Aeromicrobium sp. PE09-221]|uniref:COX15/CtaA family protein n=1 Tax=Aeromicrobium sp. PE09-221 TaxID=1898043 RepID=UPI000B3E794D|nr:COX15/CtaA family protein [Aeromicrobium sp. PE09-221]OUZ08322.1 heme A synthase [Aeromicrobium sp. PE09-221]